MVDNYLLLGKEILYYTNEEYIFVLLVSVYLQILLFEKFYIPAEIFATEPEFSFEYRFYHFIPI